MMKQAVTYLFTIIYQNTDWQTTLLNSKNVLIHIITQMYTNIIIY